MADNSRQYVFRSFVQRTRWKLSILLMLGVALILVGVWSWSSAPTSKTYHVSISGGIQRRNRQKVAEYLRGHGQRDWDLEVEIHPTAGTVEAITMLQSGQLDLALVNGLLRFPDAKRIRQVATVTNESLHLLIKNELSDQVAKDYSRLAGVSFNLGPVESETALMFGALLKFLRLRPGEDVTVTRYTLEDLMEKVDELKAADPEAADELRQGLPDVIAIYSTIPSDFVENLVDTADYNLVPVHFARAFAQIPVDEEDLDRDHVDQIRALPTEIPAYSYGGANPTPESDCPTLAAPMILVARDDVPNEVVTRLLRAIHSGAIARLYQPPPLGKTAPAYPWHEAAITYRDKDKPLVRADIAQLLRQILTGLGPLVGGCLALYGYYRWRQLLRFLEYFRQLQQYDLAAKGLGELGNLPQDQLERTRQLEEVLESRVSAIAIA